jgi:biopolymer transport protein TolR
VARRRPRLVSEINVVPYIDVMLVLLIIFMITAPMLQQGIEVNLPQAEAEQVDTQRDTPLIVSVDRAGAYFFTYGTDFVDEPVEAARLVALTRAVLERKATTPVLVRGDSDVGYGQVVRAMALLKTAGAPKVGLLTEEPEG